ncbi:protein of unknown function [Methanoculleus bourgensis]|uniref:Uncharacterized protein n=1 Tax=Methanoculleus bourgensis TaxID=83986 RepID=A0A0X3BP87_9EURY|nr:protein of unknown function [Methanoculleus bourgensis]
MGPVSRHLSKKAKVALKGILSPSLRAKAILISNLFGVQEVCHLTIEIYIVK